MASSSRLLQEGKYLAAVCVLEKALQRSGPEEKDALSQELAAAVSFVGEYDRAIALFDGRLDEGKAAVAPATSALDGAAAEDAISAIVRAVHGRQIVILNEAHHVPICRAFALRLARALRKAGFEYFAAETFSPTIAQTWRRRYPSRATGYYTIEPLFGDLVRQAIQMGYRPVGYEASPVSAVGDMYDQINRRESGEASNLVERLLKRHPKARLFIYCGYSHATKDWSTLPDGREIAWMAARLRKATGIEPLSIDQTGAMPHSRSDSELPEYRFATANGLVRGPTVFRLPDGQWGVFGKSWQGRVDMQVFHPRPRSVNGRPDWLSMDGYRKPLACPYALTFAEPRALLQAFVASEPSDATPMDQVVVEKGEPVPPLMLPPGKYRIGLQTEAGETRTLGEVRQR